MLPKPPLRCQQHSILSFDLLKLSFSLFVLPKIYLGFFINNVQNRDNKEDYKQNRTSKFPPPLFGALFHFLKWSNSSF